MEKWVDFESVKKEFFEFLEAKNEELESKGIQTERLLMDTEDMVSGTLVSAWHSKPEETAGTIEWFGNNMLFYEVFDHSSGDTLLLRLSAVLDDETFDTMTAPYFKALLEEEEGNN